MSSDVKPGNDAYREAYETIRKIVAKRHDAVYHQQAIYEALMLGTEFSNISGNSRSAESLAEREKKEISEATEQLRNSSKKFFNKDYNPEVDRQRSSRQLIALYARLVPAEQRISIFQLIDKKFQGNTDAFVDACFSQSVFSSPEALERFLKNRMQKLWPTT
mgnify:CR=1 FL=1